jgi:CRP-like cAMP-binding protein
MNTHLRQIQELFATLDEPTRAALHAVSTPKVFRKGEFLLLAGDVCRRSFWIESGMVRKFYVSQDKEITTEIYFVNDLALSFTSYVQQLPSREYIQALADTQVSALDYSQFQSLKARFPQLVQLDLLLTEYYTLWLEERLFEFHTLSATQRYTQLLAKDPHLLRLIPLTYIASYLGISLETLSRIRARI